MSKQIIAVHHSADYDGIFCREIARMFLLPSVLIGWDFGDPKIKPEPGAIHYVLDLPPDCLEGNSPDNPLDNVVWIDHHKSAILKWPEIIPGYRIDGVSACRLAWQWFELQGGNYPGGLPIKNDFLNRRVKEPLAVRLAGEYDVWDHRGDGDLEFQFGLDCLPSDYLPSLLDYSATADRTVAHAITLGKAAMTCYAKRDADIIRTRSFMVTFEGLKLLALNTARCNSGTFTALDVPKTGHDALCGFYFNGRMWTISLYHAKHRTDLDLSQIATKHGGGGHRGACGFQTKQFPF